MKITRADLAEFEEKFEKLAIDVDGKPYWYESDLMRLAGYGTKESFRKAVTSAMANCGALGLDYFENFAQVDRVVDNEQITENRLSRYGAYLTIMNGDPRKPGVAIAQNYFIVFTESFRRFIKSAEDVERVQYREDLTVRFKEVSSTATAHGVTEPALFHNAGYVGMYNMNLNDLRDRRGIGSRSPLDFMGKTEMAANLFRLTQTDEAIKNRGVYGQEGLERTAHTVGKMVRDSMNEMSGTKPENLPVCEDIKHVKSTLKSTAKEFRKLHWVEKTSEIPF